MTEIHENNDDSTEALQGLLEIDLVLFEEEEITELINDGHEVLAIEKFCGSPVLDSVIQSYIGGDSS